MEIVNEFIKDYYLTLSVIALFIIIALLACSLFCKKKDFIIGIKKEFVIWGTLVCSLIALCRTFPTSPCFDYMGIIVGVLSLLITVLMGWNIFTVIDMKNLKEETENRVNKMFQEKIEDYSIQIREQIIDTQIAENINDAIFYFQTIQHDNFMKTIANTLYLLHYH